MTTEPTAAPTTPTPESLVATPPVTPTPTEPVATTTPPAAEPTAEFVPLTAESLTFAEDFQVDEAIRDDFLGVMNDRNLSPAEQAQKLVDLQGKLAQQASEAGSQAWSDLQTTWQTEVKNDADIGGANLEPTLANISKVLDQHGSPELREVFNQTGAGNNIHMVRFLNNVAKQLTEGGPVQGTPTSAETDPAKIMYPNMA